MNLILKNTSRRAFSSLLNNEMALFVKGSANLSTVPDATQISQRPAHHYTHSSSYSYQPDLKMKMSDHRVSILAEIDDTPGSLYEILKYFWKFDVDLTHIESRPCPKNQSGFHIYIDFVGKMGKYNQ